MAKLWSAAAIAAAAGWGVRAILPKLPVYISGGAILGVYGVVYFGATYVLGVEECTRTLRRLRR